MAPDEPESRPFALTISSTTPAAVAKQSIPSLASLSTLLLSPQTCVLLLHQQSKKQK
ncbi:hypothetical protein CCM_08743 [Cordyceps militaris CM01]|uniref:Uncharacterized protein n=1 Tax=Cordyceps militaris (strain CM01) TaxID=983644 RepID=G3JS51_CORMM|nr:uncharacterized protein CCM_08743 [Cordyceps militaris CM01]EGX88697.1 hypothetical protein CCM_08743 [Cordyceps militaris CM01]